MPEARRSRPARLLPLLVAATALLLVLLLGSASASAAVNFGKAIEFQTGALPKSVASGDLNNDGQADLVTANSGAGTVSVLFGKGDGNFEAPVSYAAGTGTDGVVSADLNRGGKPDLAVSSGNRRLGGLGRARDRNLRTGDRVRCRDLAAGPRRRRLNGDDVPDIAVDSTGSLTVSIFSAKATAPSRPGAPARPKRFRRASWSETSTATKTRPRRAPRRSQQRVP